MVDEVEEEKLSGASERLGPIGEAISRIGLAKIILFIIIIAVGWWFLNLPKAANLTVTVKELDSSQPVEGAIVSILTLDGQLLGESYAASTDQNGEASFTNVPTQRGLIISVDASSAIGEFESQEQEVNLDNGVDSEQEISLAKAIRAQLQPTVVRGSASETCVKEAVVTVSNNGDNSLETEFVGTGSLQGAISSAPLTVFPASSENATIFIDVSKAQKSGGKVSGEIRLKGTSKKMSVSLEIGEAPRVTVSPSSLSCPASRETCSSIVTVENKGQTTLTNLKIEPSEAIINVLEGSDVIRYSGDSVPSGGEAKFGVTLRSSPAAIGVITVRADCFAKQIDVQTG